CRMAELVKLAENAFRDVNIAFANELAAICDRVGVDVWTAIRLANRHPRVSILRPGAGVGGHCIPLHPWFLIAAAPEEARLLATARAVNDERPRRVAERIAAVAASLPDPVVACFGLTYKADVDDLRESPAVAVVQALAARGGMKLLVCDPWVEVLPPPLAGHPALRLVGLDEALAGADVLAFLVPHAAFRGIEPKRLHDKAVIDPAGVLAEG
ncbi:MAG: UDP-N-acetyl-D-mannosamine dehydrogenase, partial [Elioraea sp.]|nr:UDP-N-acetyl-D-mannosamine dehydrogenase [Elioraea sp.]